MSWQSNGQRNSPVLICKAEESGELLGYLVIDSLVNGRSHGGIRMRDDLDETEMALLAHTMTRKYRFLNLPFGGAKAGVVGDPDAPREDRIVLLTEFGRAIKPMLESELFVPAGDMGTELADIREMLNNLGISLEQRRLPAVSSGEYTAHSVFSGIQALGDGHGIPLEGLSAAIGGFGEVGSHLAVLLVNAGVQVHAVSTSHGGIYHPGGLSVERLLALREEHGNRFVLHYERAQKLDRESLYALPVNILSPCANIHSIHQGNVGAIRAVIVCPGANNPWTVGVEEHFDRRGISYLPDFAANVGGILGTTCAYAGFSHDKIVDFIHDEMGLLQRHVLDFASSKGVSIQAAAETMLDRRLRERETTGGGLNSFLIEIGLALHRRGWAPVSLVRPFARRYLQRQIRAGVPVAVEKTLM